MRCRVFHDWMPWGPLGTGRKMWGSEYVGTLIWQERKCARCGKVQMREVN